jgi:hypothetical protein
MVDFQHFLGKLLLLSEVMAAIVGIINIKKFKNSYWKWFIYYLVFIACSELICEYVLCYFISFRTYYYDFFVIPLEFVVLYWLYSYKSLDRKKLFWISCGIYFLSLFPFFIFEGSRVVNSFNIIVGTFLLSIMIILEYNKQMKTDDILNFKENIMFYINTGVGLFYVGTLPFFAFHSLLWKDQIIWNNYYIFFMLTNILMYVLFSIAFIWGKPNTY